MLGWALKRRDLPNNFSAGNVRESVISELCEDRKEHEPKTLRLVGDFFALSDEMGCVCLDVDVSDEMFATHESIAKTMNRYTDPNDDNTEECIQQWRSKLDAIQDLVQAAAPLYTPSVANQHSS